MRDLRSTKLNIIISVLCVIAVLFPIIFGFTKDPFGMYITVMYYIGVGILMTTSFIIYKKVLSSNY